MRPKEKFRNCQVDARRRGIAFEMTFEEWWSFWQASGLWEKRGSGPDNYVMARYGDKGPYKIGNVKIITFRENSLERRLSVASRRKIGLGSKGKIVSASTRRKLRLAQLGKKATLETRLKMRQSQLQRWKKRRNKGRS